MSNFGVSVDRNKTKGLEINERLNAKYGLKKVDISR